MAYIWENYSIDKNYKVGNSVCPYIEVYNDSVTYVEVNPLIRFSEIFELLHDEEIIGYIDKMDSLDNVVFHYLAQFDKNKGMNYKQGIIEKIREEICEGYFGNVAKQFWCGLNLRDREIVLYELAQRLLNDKEIFFMETMERLFAVSSMCYEKNTNTYYLYIGAEETDYNTKKYELVKHLFWNKNLPIKPIWNVHYGIVGIRETMMIDNIQIV
jgi:hypothetical protein